MGGSLTAVSAFQSNWRRGVGFPLGPLNHDYSTFRLISTSSTVRSVYLEPRPPAGPCTRADHMSEDYERAGRCQGGIASTAPAPSAAMRPTACVGGLPHSLDPLPACGRPPISRALIDWGTYRCSASVLSSVHVRDAGTRVLNRNTCINK